MWDWLLKALLGIIEKNPTLLEKLLQALLELFTKNPQLLEKAVTVGIAHAELALPENTAIKA